MSKVLINNIKSFFHAFYSIWIDESLKETISHLSFVTLLSIVPLLAVSLSIFKTFGGMDLLYEYVHPLLFKWISVGNETVLIEFFNDLIVKFKSQTLGLLGFVGFFLSASSLFIEVDRSVQSILGIKKKRSFKKGLGLYTLIFFVLPLCFGVLVGFFSNGIIFHFQWISFVFSQVLVLFVFLYCFYQFLPLEKTRCMYALLSAAVVTLLLFALQGLYVVMVKEIFKYNEVYGSLAAIVVLMIWIKWAWTLVLGGVVLTKAMDKGFRMVEK